MSVQKAVCLYFLYIQLVASNFTRLPSSTDKCPQANQFRCSSGQCIDEDLACDGKVDCDDRSDEIRPTCWNIPCPSYTYKCYSGGCVEKNAQCNGIVDCFDGSDEDPTTCKTNTVTLSNGTSEKHISKARDTCTLPNYPTDGRWTVHGSNSTVMKPGISVGSETILKIQCNNERYRLEGDTVIFCDHGKWSTPVGKCFKTCPPIVSTPTMTVTCIHKNQEKENCTDAIDGTLAKFKCAPFYENLGLKRHPIHICRNGTWDRPTPRCVPVCGQKTVEATTLINNGTTVNKGDYPWQVALYTVKDKVLICSASLLSQNVILTAAHCVTNDRAVLFPKENYIVAVGKYYRNYNDSRDYSEAQFSELKNMIIPNRYKGDIQNYLGDIAILITKETFTLSRRVQPVCLDTRHAYNAPTDKYGFVTGWGYTVENAKPSEVLKELKIPLIPRQQCSTSLPEDYEIFLTEDKMCTGYLNSGTTICRGDAGGGLVLKHEGRYYITGIASLSTMSPTGGCDSQQYGLFTNVSQYIDNFILRTMSRT